MWAFLSYPARIGAYLITLLLAAVWTVAALETLTRPLLDIGRPAVGDVIISLASTLSLTPHATLMFALLLVGLKLLVGAFLLATFFCAAYEKMRWGSSDDSMLDVALFIAAIASIASALPGLTHGGELLNQVIGELMLCLIASGLAIYGRGYLIQAELPRPTRPQPQPQPVVISAG